MPKKCRFSVLIPVYRGDDAATFKEALDSVLGQTIEADEIVVYEDGEVKSEVSKLLDDYTQKYKTIHLIKSPVNNGLGIALRNAVLECKNDIIFRMDSDDICERNRFEKQLKFLLERNIDVIGSNTIEYDKTMMEKISTKTVPCEHKDIVRYSKSRNPMNHMSVAFKRQKVIEAGNYADMKYFEDYFLWIRMIMNGCTFYNIQEPLVKVRADRDMIKRRGGFKYYKSMMKFEKTIYKMGYISGLRYIRNIFVRSISILSPRFVRSWIYNNLLRKKNVC